MAEAGPGLVVVGVELSARTIHPFPARMAPDIAIAHLQSVGSSGPLTVLDPMCGSGTVLAAAAEQGHRPIGFDLDPLAVLMSSVATEDLDVDEFESQAIAVVEAARRHQGVAPPWHEQETQDFADYWFGKTQQDDLMPLTAAIAEVPSSTLRRALRVALSRIIITKSPRASLAADTSHSRPHRVLDTSDYEVLRGFERSVVELARLIRARPAVARASVLRGDARCLPLSDGSVDLVVTSPPYLNAIDYLRGHRLALIWFGHEIRSLRRVRSDSIGAERAISGASSRVARMVDDVKTHAVEPTLLPVGTITRYAHDLCRFSDEMARVLNTHGRVVLVIGNSTLKGNYIQNDLMVRQAMEAAGFEVTDRSERDIPDTRRYMPVNTVDLNSSMSKRMRVEVVLAMRRRSNGTRDRG